MQSKTILIVLLALVSIALSYYIYQDQQKESVSLQFGDQSISIETE